MDAEPSMVELAVRAVPAADVRVAALPELPFADGEFDAVVANFVLNHVGRPRVALAELRRVMKSGGRIALTIWAAPPAPGQALLGRAIQAAGAVRPPHLPAGLAADDDFPRDESGLTGLLTAAGLRAAECETLRWDHRGDIDEWWSGPAAGVAFGGQMVQGQTPHFRAEIKRHFDLLSAEFADGTGVLTLPHAALLAVARR
ncbi:class I SAM-dependent methyltransferase [Streptomyces sp. NPDC002328]|uniref:class I SAM-dependent methyltransferase n=1 Tax=Streptomyces sp. NPDC002328 TaxID=3364642 RepID=UPI0036903D8A